MHGRFFLFYIFFVSFAFAGAAFAEVSKASASFSSVLQQVYEKNPALKSAQQKLDETRELYPQARAGWLPSVDAETSIFSTNLENSNFGATDGATTKDLTLSLNQPLYRGGRTVAETARARSIISAEEYGLEKTRQSLILKTVTAYMDVMRDREILNLRTHNEDILQKEMIAIQQRHATGEKTVTDVQQTSARYNRARSDTIAALGNLYTSEAEFMQVTGIAPPEGILPPPMNFSFPDHVEKMVLMAEERNPEIRKAQYEREAAKAAADSAFGKLLPQVSTYASYNKQYDPQPGLIDQSEAQTIGLKATISFYDGGASWSRVREAKKAVKRRTYDIDEVRNRIRREISSDWQRCQTSRAEAESRASEIKAADQALKGVREEARLGQRTTLDVLDADQDVIGAKIAAVHAWRNEVVACYSLASVLGFLEFDDNRSSIGGGND